MTTHHALTLPLNCTAISLQGFQQYFRRAGPRLSELGFVLCDEAGAT